MSFFGNIISVFVEVSSNFMNELSTFLTVKFSVTNLINSPNYVFSRELFVSDALEMQYSRITFHFLTGNLLTYLYIKTMIKLI